MQVAREALSNVGRHAQAATCRLSLRRSREGAVLEVDDDGVGFDPSTSSGGMGLENLRGRVEAMGGGFDVTSGPSTGTTVRAVFPL